MFFNILITFKKYLNITGSEIKNFCNFSNIIKFNKIEYFL